MYLNVGSRVNDTSVQQLQKSKFHVKFFGVYTTDAHDCLTLGITKFYSACSLLYQNLSGWQSKTFCGHCLYQGGTVCGL